MFFFCCVFLFSVAFSAGQWRFFLRQADIQRAQLEAAAADESADEDDGESSDESDSSSSFGKRIDSEAEEPRNNKRAKAAAKSGSKRKSTGQRQDLPATTRRRTKGPPDTPDKKLGSHLEACQKYIDSLTELSVDSVWRNVIRAAEAASFWGEAFKCGSCEVGQPKLDQDSVPNRK